MWEEMWYKWISLKGGKTFFLCSRKYGCVKKFYVCRLSTWELISWKEDPFAENMSGRYVVKSLRKIKLEIWWRMSWRLGDLESDNLN